MFCLEVDSTFLGLALLGKSGSICLPTAVDFLYSLYGLITPLSIVVTILFYFFINFFYRNLYKIYRSCQPPSLWLKMLLSSPLRVNWFWLARHWTAMWLMMCQQHPHSACAPPTWAQAVPSPHTVITLSSRGHWSELQKVYVLSTE